MPFRTMEYQEGVLRLIDQRRLPLETAYLDCRTAAQVWEAIKTMAVRGAPALAIAAAYGLVLGVRSWIGAPPRDPRAEFHRLCDWMAEVRPTAVNLSWAVERMRRVGSAALTEEAEVHALSARLETEADAMYHEDIETNHAIGRHGQALIPDGARVLTHCNAGALATAGYGTALGVIRAAVEEGKRLSVMADETRPFLQGARLTAWELMQDGIDVTLITDSMSAHMMKTGRVDCVIVGADRVAVNGDTANKIGTYALAILARHHGLPFYVAAPLSTLDPTCPDGAHIPIEERPAVEVTDLGGRRIAPEGIKVANPSFDVVPAVLITAIVTERGLARPPNRETLAALRSVPRAGA